MKFLHTSDWHIGMSFRGGLTYAKDQEFVINQICEIAVRENVDGILVAGDIFDRSIASAEAIEMYDRIITHICSELNIPVFIIAGNHDGAERLSQCSELLKKSGLYIVGSLTREPQVVNMGDVDIYMLPWISTDKVKAVFDVHGTSDKRDHESQRDDGFGLGDDEKFTLETAYRVVLDSYRKAFIPGHKNILLAHAFVTGAETSVSDKSAIVGNAAMISADVFEGFDYVALGHLHGPQSIKENIRYSGTPMAYSFGNEEKQEKSVVLVDIKQDGVTENYDEQAVDGYGEVNITQINANGKLVDITTIPLLQLKKRTTLKGTYDELMAADFAEDIKSGYVRLEITDKYAGLEAISQFREKYENLLEVVSPSFDHSDEKITMTIEEFERVGSDPAVIFTRYCEDILMEEPSEHMLTLFKNALDKTMEESK